MENKPGGPNVKPIRSPFNTRYQGSELDSKLVVALDRVSEAFRVLVWEQSRLNALSPIQIQIIIFLLFKNEEICTVSSLARQFNLTKATISDSIRSLVEKGLVSRCPNLSDARSCRLVLTTSGETEAYRSANFTSKIEDTISKLPVVEKAILLSALLKIIRELNHAAVISPQRMCLSCKYFSSKDGIHFCHLLGAALTSDQLRVDCEEHSFS